MRKAPRAPPSSGPAAIVMVQWSGAASPMPSHSSRARRRQAQYTDLKCRQSANALEFARSGDTLIVRKLDQLVPSIKQLIETVETCR